MHVCCAVERSLITAQVTFPPSLCCCRPLEVFVGYFTPGEGGKVFREGSRGFSCRHLSDVTNSPLSWFSFEALRPL